jgi:P-type Ca2+ transporter type 2C
MIFHATKPEEILKHFKSNSKGLTNEQVESAQKKFGRNEIPEAEKLSLFGLFIKQFKSFLVLVLVIAAVISWFAEHEIDAVVIMAIVIVNAIIGFSQEYKAEQAIASLKKMMVPTAKVLRNGQTLKIDASELVPGDIFLLEEGDSIPADGYLLESSNLRCIESSLTGESVPVEKELGVLPEVTSLGDRKNMVLKSTFVAGGAGKAVVIATALDTAIGQIADTLSSMKNEPTNFQKKTKILARQMAIFAITLSAVLFVVAYFIRKYELHEVFMVSIAALVSSIPEGLPAILSIVLAIGANKMAKRNAIIREFTATETLGAITTIITDKTGTLTQNVLYVEKVYIPNDAEYDVFGQGYNPEGEIKTGNQVIEDSKSNPLFNQLLNIAALSNNSQLKFNDEKQSWEILGDPTEAALLVLAKKAGYTNAEEEGFEKIADMPFSSDIKMRATLVKNSKGKKQILLVGAPEKILEKSSFLMKKGNKAPMTEAERENLAEQIGIWSDKAMRVIGLAYIDADNTDKINKKELKDFVFAGFTGMTDPPRPEVKEAISNCKMAGIRVIMATGDHVKTASAIGKQTGIVGTQKEGYPLAIDENELLELSDEAFDNIIQNVNVFARLTPNMKLRIAERLQENGELIAMTGDGVNDAPALKKADVGISMGIMGTDVARDSSQMVLADDNFATIVNAIEEGRIVFRNARQAAFFLITTNFAEILTIIAAISIGLPMPLTAIQILWLNLVTDGASGLALATEPGHGDVLKQKPVDKNENILNKDVFPFLIINAVIMAVLAIGAFKFHLPDNLANASTEEIEKGRTAVFIILAYTQLFNALNMRDLKFSVFKIGLFSNKYINLALLVSVALQVMVIEVPYLKNIFGLRRLEFSELIVLVALSSLVLVGGEIYKLYQNRGK